MWNELIGKTIVGYRGYRMKNSQAVDIMFILFSDKETILELREQDQYDYHDCNNSARVLNLSKNERLWAEMFNKEGIFDESTKLGYSPF
jgi:hypothetical protein